MDEKKVQNAWIDVWQNEEANVFAYSESMALVEDQGALVIGGVDGSVRQVNGCETIWETTLSSRQAALVAGVVSFTAEENSGIDVAVARGNQVHILRDGSLAYKIAVPGDALEGAERDAWECVANESSYDIEDLVVRLKSVSSRSLTGRSMDLLALEADVNAREEYVKQYLGCELVENTCITCITTLKKERKELLSPSFLILGTENKQILLVNAATSEIIKRIPIDGIPVFICCFGVHRVDYRIIVATRSGKVCSIKNGKTVRGGGIVNLESSPCGLVGIGTKTVVLGCRDRSVHSYSVKGRQNFSFTVDSSITSMARFERNEREGFFLALATGEVSLYIGDRIVSRLKLGKQIVGLKFGVYNREKDTLLLLDETGGLSVKVLKRTATLSENAPQVLGPPEEQDTALPIPKKTDLYIAQADRERQQATSMHNAFQSELARLRLAVTRAYVKLLDEHPTEQIATDSRSKLHLSAKVVGMRHHRLEITIQNTDEEVQEDITVATSSRHDGFQVLKPIIHIPMLLPGVSYPQNIPVHRKEDTVEAGEVVVSLVKSLQEGSTSPVLTATVKLPVACF